MQTLSKMLSIEITILIENFHDIFTLNSPDGLEVCLISDPIDSVKEDHDEEKITSYYNAESITLSSTEPTLVTVVSDNENEILDSPVLGRVYDLKSDGFCQNLIGVFVHDGSTIEDELDIVNFVNTAESVANDVFDDMVICISPPCPL